MLCGRQIGEADLRCLSRPVRAAMDGALAMSSGRAKRLVVLTGKRTYAALPGVGEAVWSCYGS